MYAKLMQNINLTEKSGTYMHKKLLSHIKIGEKKSLVILILKKKNLTP